MLKIKPNPPEYNHDELYCDDKYIGFVVKKSGKRCLTKCPKCGRENYAMAVTTGVCAWCLFDVKEEQ